MRSLGAFVAIFALMLLGCLTAVGQLGKIDGQTLVVALAVSLAAACVAAWRTARRGS